MKLSKLFTGTVAGAALLAAAGCANVDTVGGFPAAGIPQPAQPSAQSVNVVGSPCPRGTIIVEAPVVGKAFQECGTKGVVLHMGNQAYIAGKGDVYNLDNARESTAYWRAKDSALARQERADEQAIRAAQNGQRRNNQQDPLRETTQSVRGVTQTINGVNQVVRQGQNLLRSLGF